MNADRLRLLFAGLDRAGNAGTLTAMVEKRRPLLLGTPGAAAALTSDGEMDEERRLAVFSLVVDEARLDMENRGRLGGCAVEKFTSIYCGQESRFHTRY